MKNIKVLSSIRPVYNFCFREMHSVFAPWATLLEDTFGRYFLKEILNTVQFYFYYSIYLHVFLFVTTSPLVSCFHSHLLINTHVTSKNTGWICHYLTSIQHAYKTDPYHCWWKSCRPYCPSHYSESYCALPKLSTVRNGQVIVGSSVYSDLV
jgi:hypothetical protein